VRLFEFEQQELEIDNTLASIAKECSNILAIYKKTETVAYRGIPGIRLQGIFSGVSPENRAPKHTPKETDMIINKALDQAGFSARRDNSIFVTSELSTAKTYAEYDDGETYVIFPVNGFKFTYSRKHKDLTLGLGFVTADYATEENPDVRNNKHVTWKMKHAYIDLGPKGFCNHLGFTSTNIEYALQNDLEIYIKGKYYAISRKYYKQIEEFLGFTI
jgi:hypothetical protein